MTGKRRHQMIEDSSEDSDFDYDNSSNAYSHSGSVESNELQPRKRGRGPSKRPCLNRNALMARMNRQKKKEYVEQIESKLMHYRQEIKELTNKNQKQCIDLKRLNAEVLYLKNVLNNNTNITSLLKSMNEILRRGKRKSEISSKSICHVEEKEADYEKEKGVNYNPNNGQVSIKESSSPHGLSDSDLEQLNSMDMFNNLNDDLDDNEPIDFIKPNSPVESIDLFNDLGNNGICVHVNPRGISLEFCSACHVNSANSDVP